LGGRGRLTTLADRMNAIELIDEAITNGARESKACEEIGISHRTLKRWKDERLPVEDQRPNAEKPEPKNKLSQAEEEEILRVCNLPEYRSLSPNQIVPKLADKGIYLASESTFYRVLKKHKQNHHRGRAKKPESRPITTHYATKPNQVWMWDITYLPGPVKGTFFYLYLILDLFSRKVVGWEVWPEESAINASLLVRRSVLKEQCRPSKEPLVLHSDNGSPMKAATLLETLYKLGIIPSRSRPRVSNDNPYAESIFKTIKYMPAYPSKGFSTLVEARQWVQKFEYGYNHHHQHSGIQFLTPNQRHNGQSEKVLANRREVYEEAKSKNPERWSKHTRKWEIEDKVWLNPEREEKIENHNTKLSS